MFQPPTFPRKYGENNIGFLKFQHVSTTKFLEKHIGLCQYLHLHPNTLFFIACYKKACVLL